MKLLARFGAALASLTIAATVASVAMAGEQQATTSSDTQTVTLTAVLFEGKEPLKDVSFRLKRSGHGVPTLVFRKEGAPAEFEVPKGSYRLKARHGDAIKFSDINVGAKPVQHQTSFEAGWVRLSAVPHHKAKELDIPIKWKIYTFGKDAFGNRYLVAEKEAPTPELVLREGYYMIHARTPDAFVKHTIEVTKGVSFNYALNLYAGRLAGRAVAQSGSLKDDEVVWEVYPLHEPEDKPLSKRVGVKPEFLLKEGKYRIVAHAGDRRAEETLDIKAGNQQSVKLVLK